MLDSLKEQLDRVLDDYPGIVEQAAKLVYLADSDDSRDDWAEQTNEFRELYRSEVRLVLGAVSASLPTRLRAVA